jgi:CRISPR/Cas system-associated exonuclease Cas4 (RecB family)
MDFMKCGMSVITHGYSRDRRPDLKQFVQSKEVSTQIKAQATFHERFEQSLSATKQLIESNAKAIAANSTKIDSERKAIRELRQTIRDSRFDNLDRHRRTSRKDYILYDILEDIQEDIREIGRKIDRQNPSS